MVDLRIGSPTFGTVDAVRLDTRSRRAAFIAEGLGHAFMALDEGTVVAYLCSTGYAPAREHGVHPLDESLALPWPADIAPLLSPKDADAPLLSAAADMGLLPRYDECLTWYQKHQ